MLHGKRQVLKPDESEIEKFPVDDNMERGAGSFLNHQEVQEDKCREILKSIHTDVPSPGTRDPDSSMLSAPQTHVD